MREAPVSKGIKLDGNQRRIQIKRACSHYVSVVLYSRRAIISIKIAIILMSSLFLFSCATQEREEKKVTISFMNAEGAMVQIKAMQEIVRGFEALNPDIKVKMEWVTGLKRGCLYYIYRTATI